MAPLSRRAIPSALLVDECKKNQIVIDFRADIYTFVELLCLTRADLIRLRENPCLGPWQRSYGSSRRPRVC